MLISEELFLLEKYCTKHALTQKDRRTKIVEYGSVSAFAESAAVEMAIDGEDSKLLTTLQRQAVRFIDINHPSYPLLLREISNPPAWLYLRTGMDDSELTEGQAETYCLSIVGSRRPTPYGLQVTENLLDQLQAREVTIVSGLAIGIDSCAHRQALTLGMPTWAFLPCGIESIYPTRHMGLAETIIESPRGMIWSEFAPGTPPKRQHFPVRNRLISGVSAHIAVIEAGARSGSAITAGFAADQGREVWAVPGSVYMRMSAGCLELIRDGANVLIHASELCEQFPAREREQNYCASGGISIAAKESSENNTDRDVLAFIGAVEPDSERLINWLKRNHIDPYKFLADRQVDGSIERRWGRWYLRNPLS